MKVTEESSIGQRRSDGGLDVQLPFPYYHYERQEKLGQPRKNRKIMEIFDTKKPSIGDIQY